MPSKEEAAIMNMLGFLERTGLNGFRPEDIINQAKEYLGIKTDDELKELIKKVDEGKGFQRNRLDNRALYVGDILIHNDRMAHVTQSYTAGAQDILVAILSDQEPYEIIEDKSPDWHGDGSPLFSKSHSTDGLKIMASPEDLSITPLETIWPVKINNLKLQDGK